MEDLKTLIDQDLEGLQTPSDDTSLWRYMSLSKFAALAQTQSLYFSSLLQFSDSWEGRGSPNDRLIKLLRGTHPNVIPAEEEFQDIHRKSVVVNCWHTADSESELMWRRYTNYTTGVAIRTTVGALKNALPVDELFYIRTVEYGKVAESSYRVVFQKRVQFKQDSEVRVMHPVETDVSIMEAPDGHVYSDIVPPVPGLSVKVDLAKLLQVVYPAPHADDWVVKVVQTLLGDLWFRETQSSLKD